MNEAYKRPVTGVIVLVVAIIARRTREYWWDDAPRIFPWFILAVIVYVVGFTVYALWFEKHEDEGAQDQS